MKTSCLLFLLCGVALAHQSTAQTATATAAPASKSPPVAAAPAVAESAGFLAPDFQAPTVRRSRASAALATPGRPNEIRFRNKTYSGIAVQVVKTKNPLQLINPFAPAEYGSGWDNAVRDMGGGSVLGLKVLAVGFN